MSLRDSMKAAFALGAKWASEEDARAVRSGWDLSCPTLKECDEAAERILDFSPRTAFESADDEDDDGHAREKAMVRAWREADFIYQLAKWVEDRREALYACDLDRKELSDAAYDLLECQDEINPPAKEEPK